MEIGKTSDGAAGAPGEAGRGVTDIKQRVDAKIGTKDDIEMRLGATLVHLPIVRSVAVNIAMRADFDLDAISDLEMAVDESCSSLITRAVPDSLLIARFTISRDKIVFTATITSRDNATPSTKTFGWRVLNTLTDAVESWTEPAQGSSHFYLVHIELSKRRPVVEG